MEPIDNSSTQGKPNKLHLKTWVKKSRGRTYRPEEMWKKTLQATKTVTSLVVYCGSLTPDQLLGYSNSQGDDWNKGYLFDLFKESYEVCILFD